MSLTKEERELVDIGSEIESMLTLKAWKAVKAIWEAMYLDVLGGVDKTGDLVDGAIDDEKVEYQFVLGYRKALADLWKRAVKVPIAEKNRLLELLHEEEKAEKTKSVNLYEEDPTYMPNL